MAVKAWWIWGLGAIGIAIVILLAVIAYALLTDDDGATDTAVDRITPTVSVSALETPTPTVTPSPTPAAATPETTSMPPPSAMATSAPAAVTVLTPPTPSSSSMTAREAYPLAVEQARGWQPDSHLFGAESGGDSGFAWEDSPLDKDGKCCRVWLFRAYSPTKGEVVDVRVAFIERVPTAHVLGEGHPPAAPNAPRPELTMDERILDSTEIMGIANLNGGDAFKAGGNRLYIIELYPGSAAGDWLWAVDYGPESREGGPGLRIVLSAANGSVRHVIDTTWRKFGP